MADRNHSNLEREAWLKKLRDLAVHCPANEPHSAANRIRELNYLIGAAPEPALLEGLRAIAPYRLEALIDAGACDAAALKLFGEGSSYLLSRSGDDLVMATVALLGTMQEKSAQGATPALALVGAIARSLANAAAAARMRSRLPATPKTPHLVAVPALH